MNILSLIAAAVMTFAQVTEAPAVDTAAQSGLSVSAEGCVVIDALSGDVLYGKNAEKRLPMASTTKIMSAFIALRQEGLDTPFVADSEAMKVEGSSMGLQQGDTVTLRTLVYGMLLPSGNDAANVTAVRVAGTVPAFVELMNDCACEMGLENTHFVTPSGLDDDTDEHYSTALDMARLTREALKSEDFREICSCRNAQVEFGSPPYKRWLTNTNKLLSTCKGCIGVKTGFTDKAGRCLVSACEREGTTLICVTLNDRDDWADHSKLYDFCFSQLEEVPLTPELSGYRIACAGAGEDACAVGDSGSIRLPGSAVSRLERVTLIRPFLYQPLSAGEQVGETRFYLDGVLIKSLPITLAGSIHTGEKNGKDPYSEAYCRQRLLFPQKG